MSEKIKIKVHANSRIEKIKKVKNGEYEVWIKERPTHGKANIYLEKFLKKHFGKKCAIILGFSSKIKHVELAD